MPAPELPQRRPSGRALQDFAEQLAKAAGQDLIYPGHDYIENNLRFTLDREPDNRKRADMLDRHGGQDPANAFVTTLDVERRINTFFRLTSPTVIAKLREAFPDLPEEPDQRTVFLKLRELATSGELRKPSKRGFSLLSNATLHPETLAAQGMGRVAVPYGDIVPPIHVATTYERGADGDLSRRTRVLARRQSRPTTRPRR